MSKFEGIRIIDSFRGEVSVAPNKVGVFKEQDSTGTSLVVKIPMTHAGIQTRNRGLYLPAKMMKGKDSFTKPYEKPVLVGHGGGGMFGGDDSPKAVGRVKDVTYVETLDILQKDTKMAGFYKDHLVKDAEQSFEASKALTKHILKNYYAKPKKDYKGLGYLEGILNIADPEAAQKILDGRYLTVSTSQGSTDAWCSACWQNLAKDGMCEHRRGEMVDGAPMTVVLGDMFYDHVGIIDSPADPFAHGFQLYTGKDSVEIPSVDVLDGNALEVAARCFIYYNKDNIQPVDTDQPVNLVQLNDAIGGIISAMAKKNTDPAKTEDTQADPAVVVDAKTDPVVTEPTVVVTEDKDPIKELITTFRDKKLDIPVEDFRDAAELFKDASDDKPEAKEVLGIPADQKYAVDKIDEYLVAYKKFYDSLVSFELLTAEDSYKYFEEVLDAESKLVTEDLAKLPLSSFCGPNRSFPVPNAVHATAARKVLGRAKASAETKATIVASIDRRSKTFKSDPVTPKEEVDSTVLDTANTVCDNKVENQHLTKITDADLKTQLVDFKKELLARGLTDSCSHCSEKDKQVKILGAQLDAAYEEVDGLTAQFAELEDTYKTQLVERVVDLKILSGDSVEDRESTIAKHKERAVVSLEDSLEDLLEKVNLADVATKLNNGISREPTGQVQNPVLQDNKAENTPASENSKKDNKQRLQTVYDSYDYICKHYGKAQADAYIEKCRSDGLISE